LGFGGFHCIRSRGLNQAIRLAEQRHSQLFRKNGAPDGEHLFGSTPNRAIPAGTANRQDHRDKAKCHE
jgi:hypothetical protein